MSLKRMTLIYAVASIGCSSPGGDYLRGFPQGGFFDQEDIGEEAMDKHGVSHEGAFDSTMVAGQVRTECVRAGNASKPINTVIAWDTWTAVRDK
ncbi:hypothetical protein [Antrihabitans stalactiti]|uniref:Uncharacterized protein n=1 Tax=Antrihabitans stalactiti TaxID=2584121 RepID=A0A848KGN9_9NOCA|nr:hypothetical protein [Antrihabitans stalactiti]NMN95087.1 hypothetical protein [Antrihabitans stalactiti]